MRDEAGLHASKPHCTLSTPYPLGLSSMRNQGIFSCHTTFSWRILPLRLDPRRKDGIEVLKHHDRRDSNP